MACVVMRGDDDGIGKCGNATNVLRLFPGRTLHNIVQCTLPPTLRTMQITDVSMLLAALVLVAFTGVSQLRSGAEAAPAEGLTPFGFLMARAYGEPVDHQVMRFIAFKPSDGAKFRETFEKKHGPRGRDLIDSLGRGSYKAPTDQSPDVAAITAGVSGKTSDKNPALDADRARQ